MKQSTVRLITHTDLDGLGCDVIVKEIYPNAVTTFAEYKTVAHDIVEAIHENPDVLIISDVWPNDAPEVHDALIEFDGVLQIFDHHGTAESSQYKVSDNRNTTVIKPTKAGGHLRGFDKHGDIYVHGEGTSATKYLADFYQVSLPSVEHVNHYDTTGDSTGIHGDLNTLFYELPRSWTADILRRDPFKFHPDEVRKLAEVEQDRSDYFDQQEQDTHITAWIEGHKVAWMEGTRHKAYLYNRLLCDADYAILYDCEREHVGLRGNLDGVDEVASKFGGGGHPQAAGFTGRYKAVDVFQKFREVLIEE